MNAALQDETSEPTLDPQQGVALRGLEERLDALGSGFGAFAEPSFTPRMDVVETPGSMRLHIDLPGVSRDDITIDAEDQVLVICGVRRHEDIDDAHVRLQERATGTFSRSLYVPGGFDPDTVKAVLRDGVLTIVVPRRTDTEKKRIPVSVR
ncbi:Hsp20/alpha crystallin family protein [Phenylobacterium immobile]|uniref:Hsp20/alpha crystallin family protein n=1 Tax=Phenylobacterium immobile TaxID=21 RepID=UPI000A6218D9|nr:Hsp20/alpha crystallin family protein [Phenylobacterium immobile]